MIKRALVTSIFLAAVADAADQSGRSDANDLVIMRQFIVEASHLDWKYLSTPGCEILSRSDNDVTRWYATGLFRSVPLQQNLLPDGYLPPPAVPITAILYNQKSEQDTAAKVIPKPVEKTASADQGFWGRYEAMPEISGGTMVRDPDTEGIVNNLWDARRVVDVNGGLQILHGMLEGRLSHIVPAVPFWFAAGCAGPFGLSRIAYHEKQIVVPGALWISRAESEAFILRAQSVATQKEGKKLGDVIVMDPFIVRANGPSFALLPMKELFRERMPGEEPPERIWWAEAALFVRWGYFGRDSKPNIKEAFSKFVARARTEPVTEAMFRDCFGFGYAEMESRLARYLPKAAMDVISLQYAPGKDWPWEASGLIVRRATPDEVARIIGDWERMKGDEIKVQQPALSRLYLEEAGKILLRAYQEGSRDPRLLAVLGMYEHDIGDDVRARPFLEDATKAGVVRPIAYIDLAALRYLDAQAHPAGAGGKFDAQQMIGVLSPLFAARKQAALAPIGYRLIADTWERSSFKPTSENLAVLPEGVKLYPRIPDLAFRAATVDAQWGYRAESIELVDLGLKFAEGDTADKLEHLRTKLEN